jgi:hypothetical protein
MLVKLENYKLGRVVQVFATIGSEKLSAKLSFKLTKVLTTVQKHQEEYEKARTELIREYAKKNEDGSFVLAKNEKGEEIPNSLHFEPEQEVEINKQLAELGLVLVEILTPVKLSIEDLGEKSFTVEEMIVLEPFIEE